MMDKIKKLKNKKIYIIITFLSVVVFITLFKLVIKDTHAYYNSVTDPAQIFNGKVGNFKPRIDSFYIKEITTPKYTNHITNTVYLTPGNNNSNLDQVCITETDDINTCNGKWQPIQSNNQYSYTFPDVTEGSKVIFGFVKDRYGNKSISRTDTITYDVTPPTIESVTATDTQETSVTLKVNANTDLSGIDKYCYSTSNSGEGTCVTSTDGNITISNLKDGTSYTYYFYLTDKAGNSGITNKKSHTFETESAGITGQDLINDRENIPNLQDTPVDGLYRFKGTASQVDNNYICLGASENPDVCKTDPENMYRIIGVTTDGKLKVIKAKKYGANQAWHSDAYSDVKWNASNLYTNLNGTFYNSLNSRIQGLIDNYTWKMEKTTLTPGTTTGNQDGTVQAHIGLMYGSDYVNAYQNSSKDNWLFITNGWSGNIAENEWIMSKYGYYYGRYYAWGVYTDGSLDYWYVDNTYAVRPVFYLSSSVGLIGEGTTTHPYTVTGIS